MNLWESFYNAQHEILGRPAVLRIGQVSHAIQIIDQTTGVEVHANNVGMPTVKAAALVRVTELARISVEMSALIDAVLVIGSNEWTVKNVAPQPGPDGKGTGEYQLILINGDL